jgi:uncharacterized membrane protein
MLIVFPLGLFVFSLVADVVWLASRDASWWAAAWYTMGGGIVGALLAAGPGFVDLLSTTGRARTIAIWHMAINLLAVVLYIVNFFVRMDPAAPGGAVLALSIVGVGMLVVSGYLGGSLVYKHRIAVTEEGEAAPAAKVRRPPQEPGGLPHAA